MTFLSPSKEKFLLKTIIILNQPIAFSVSYMCPHRHIDMNTQTHEYFAMVQFLSVFFTRGKLSLGPAGECVDSGEDVSE